MDNINKDTDQIEIILGKLFQNLKNRQAWLKMIHTVDNQLDRPSVAILHCLNSSKNKLNLNELAFNLEVEAPFLSRKTIQLEELGYIKRVKSSQDKRQVYYLPTPKAKQVINKIRLLRRKKTKLIFKDWSDNERSLFIKLLDKFVNQFVNLK